MSRHQKQQKQNPIEKCNNSHDVLRCIQHADSYRNTLTYDLKPHYTADVFICKQWSSLHNIIKNNSFKSSVQCTLFHIIKLFWSKI